MPLTPGADVATISFEDWIALSAGSDTATISFEDWIALTAGADAATVSFDDWTHPLILTGTLPNGTINVSYHGEVDATGGAPPYAFTVSDGALPTGLALNAITGSIDGVPTATGIYAFDITVTDTATNTDTVSYSVTIGIVTQRQPDLFCYPFGPH